MALQDKFYQARKAMLSIPDVVPHPDHVHVSNGTVTIQGPIDHAGRDAWELLKAAIRVAACLHEILRTEFRREPTDTVREQLKAIEAHRRSLMRKVPKGWNWREEIYCCGSQLDFAKETVRNLERIGYVAPDAED